MDPELGGVQPTEINIPLVSLANAMLRIDTFPTGERMLVIGPVALAVHLTDDVEKWMVDQMKGSGILIARPDQMPNGGPSI